MNNNDDIQQVPIDQITILNPRSRNKRLFNTIVANIDHVGLKRPITITPRADGKYDLVCGQGRLEAYQALGASSIPAIIIIATKEDRYLMSLVENIARRRHTTTELLKEGGIPIYDTPEQCARAMHALVHYGRVRRKNNS